MSVSQSEVEFRAARAASERRYAEWLEKSNAAIAASEKNGSTNWSACAECAAIKGVMKCAGKNSAPSTACRSCKERDDAMLGRKKLPAWMYTKKQTANAIGFLPGTRR